jgi:hypothetical protein
MTMEIRSFFAEVFPTQPDILNVKVSTESLVCMDRIVHIIPDILGEASRKYPSCTIVAIMEYNSPNPIAQSKLKVSNRTKINFTQ